MPIPTVVESLVGLLGATTVAEIAGVKETRAVQQWASGEREPQRSHVLRFALQLAMMISTVTSRHMAGAWFHGANPHLDDQIPIVLLREQPLESIQVPVDGRGSIVCIARRVTRNTVDHATQARG